MVRGICTYNETFGDIFKRRCRFYSFRTCPYLSNSSLRFYKPGHVLSIFGSGRSGMSTLISHIIHDLIKSKNSGGKIVFVDTEYGFDFDTLMSLLENTEDGNQNHVFETLLSNLLYLPVSSSAELNTIVKSLEECIKLSQLEVHSILFHSAHSQFNKARKEAEEPKSNAQTPLKRVITLCKNNSIFLICTDDIEMNSGNRTFLVDLNDLKMNEDNADATQNPDFDHQHISPNQKRPADNSLENLQLSKLFMSSDSNISNDYKRGLCSFGRSDSYSPNANQYQAELELNRNRLKLNVPERWFSNETKESKRGKMELLMSSSRIGDKTYCTFVSKDYRIKERVKRAAPLSQGSNESSKSATSQSNTKLKELLTIDTHFSTGSSSENDRSRIAIKRNLEDEGSNYSLNKLDFRVYRINPKNRYTECNIEL